MPSYLVETYLARGQGEPAAPERRARSAAEGLTRVSFDRAIHITEDEICFYVFEAPAARDAALAAELAGLDPLRVVETVSFGKEQQ
jgi:hypothetical protein